jgi:phospholipase C
MAMRCERLGAFSLACISLAACGGNKGVVKNGNPIPPGLIKHVVVIMQENRTFDDMFNGYPGADTVQSGSYNGTEIALKPVPLEQGTDLGHSHTDYWKDWDNGLLDGFDHFTEGTLAYAYVPRSETVPLWTLASHYTLGDRMFQSNTGPSFPAHQYLIAGQADDVADNPHPKSNVWGCDSAVGAKAAVIGPNGTELPGVFPCFNYETVADLMDAKGITWRYYAPAAGNTGYIWSAFDAISHIRYGSDWATNVISPDTKVLTDIQNGNLAQVTWIVPDLSYSDHASPVATAEGPDWVTSIVNEIGASPFWDSTVIFISWDDWGGWYDHVNPPVVDNMGLGFRVPLIVVSPYAKRGYISHTTHEFAGFLVYMEQNFNLGSLGTRDATADDLNDCFDYTQTPQPYVQIPVAFSADHFVHKKVDKDPPDDD